MYLKSKSKLKNFFNSAEEAISMFLGLVIVIVIASLIFNFFQKKKGDVSIPGANDVTVNVDNDTKNNNSEANKNTYEVLKGDSLWKIAEKKMGDGNKWKEIAQVNKIDNPGLIRSGQKLIMLILSETSQSDAEVKESKTESIADGEEYTVVRGDSLWKIAQKTYNDGNMWVKVWENNKSIVENPRLIHVGNKIILPKLSK